MKRLRRMYVSLRSEHGRIGAGPVSKAPIFIGVSTRESAEASAAWNKNHVGPDPHLKPARDSKGRLISAHGKAPLETEQEKQISLVILLDGAALADIEQGVRLPSEEGIPGPNE